jgi:hypothetical protein
VISTSAVSPRTDVPAWHEPFLMSVLPQVLTVARFQFRRLAPTEREEATAEATATALRMFVRAQQRGKDSASVTYRIAQFAVRRVKIGRTMGSRTNSRDVLSRFARNLRGFVLESLDDRSETDGWQGLLIESRRTNPADMAAARLDVADWLGRLSPRHRQIAETLAAGHDTGTVAQQFGLSPGRISQLRKEFHASWCQFQEDPKEAPSAQRACSRRGKCAA